MDNDRVCGTLTAIYVTILMVGFSRIDGRPHSRCVMAIVTQILSLDLVPGRFNMDFSDTGWREGSISVSTCINVSGPRVCACQGQMLNEGL